MIEVGINVVLTAHMQMRKFELPNEGGSFDRYELKLGKKTSSQTAPLVKEWADMLLFANYKTIVIAQDKDGKKCKAAGGERVMYTTHHLTGMQRTDRIYRKNYPLILKVFVVVWFILIRKLCSLCRSQL